MKIIFLFFFIFNLSLNSESFRDKNNENIYYENVSSLKKSYKSYISNEIFLKKISLEYNFIEYHSLAITNKGFDLPAIKITSKNNQDKISILFNCAHHADEISSIEHCYDIIYNLLENKEKYLSNYLDKLIIWIIPIVNPDGSYYFWEESVLKGRKNNNEVDLNRNYPFMWGEKNGSSKIKTNQFYRGEFPISEIETRALITLFNNNNFIFSVSYHASGKKILIPYTINNVKNPSEDYPKFFGEKISKQINYTLVKNLYPVDGTDQDFFYYKYGTISFLLESEKNNPNYSEINNIMLRSRKIWEEIINESIFGNKIYLKTVDEKNKPISVNIEIKEIKFYNGEKYFSSEFSGLFNRMVLNENYTISFYKEDYEKQTLNIKATKSNQIQIIKMKKIIP